MALFHGLLAYIKSESTLSMNASFYWKGSLDFSCFLDIHYFCQLYCPNLGTVSLAMNRAGVGYLVLFTVQKECNQGIGQSCAGPLLAAHQLLIWRLS